MNRGNYEDFELLLHHSEFVLSQLELTVFQFREDGKIMAPFKTSEGQKVKQYVDDISPKPGQKPVSAKLTSAQASFVEKIAVEMLEPVKILDYSLFWCQCTITQLKTVLKNVREFDIRWNLPITLHFMKLFSAFCRIVLYINNVPSASFILKLFSLSENSKKVEVSFPIADILNFIDVCKVKPFQFISEQLRFLRQKFQTFLVGAAQFLTSIFSESSVFDWRILNIYEIDPKDTVGNSMPLDEYTILSHLPLFHTVCSLFLIIFPEQLAENTQLNMLCQSLLSESATFPLSRKYSIDTDKLLSFCPTTTQISALKSGLLASIEKKNKKFHMKRIRYLASFSSDIENLSHIDLNRFCQSIHIITAISSLAYYEIDTFFRSKDKNWDSKHISSVCNLFYQIVFIGKVFISQRAEIERFFFFNLATADAEYLSQMLSKFDTSIGSHGGDIVETAILILEALNKLDLDNFDKGKRYDFYPLMLTHGRALIKHNILSQSLRIMFLNPLFECLYTISSHGRACSNAPQFFFDYCPIHTFWAHEAKFEKFIDDKHTPVNELVAFFHVFTAFNYDSVVISMYNFQANQLKESLENKVRAKISSRFLKIINQMFADSKLLSYINDAETGSFPSPEKLSTNFLDVKKITKEAKIVEDVAEANLFISKLPEMINLFNNKIFIADFFVSRLSKDLVRILVVNTNKNVHSVCGASQVVWNFFSQARGLAIKDQDEIGHVFLRALYDFLVTSSFFAGRSFNIQATALCGKPPAKPPVPALSQTIIEEMSKNLVDFITKNHPKNKYISAVHRFNDSNYSYPYFKHLIRLFGVHGALFFDNQISQLIAKDIVILYQKMTAVISSQKELTLKTVTMKEGSPAFDALLRISVGLAIRSMILRASETVINESLPGFSQFAGVSEMTVTLESDLIREVLNYKNNYCFIAQRAQSQMQSGDSSKFVEFSKFLGFLFACPDWKSMEFFPEEDALTNNIHLIPLGLDMLFSISNYMFTNVKTQDVQNGISQFVNSLGAVYTSIKENKSLPAASQNSFLILVDKIPKNVPLIEYGTIKNVFPSSLLSSCYPVSK